MSGPCGLDWKRKGFGETRMISHRYKCIFIHIPRCGGTSIEHWIEGTDWWNVDPCSKHLLASQARELYAQYWDTYFKFAFVREPEARTRSMLKYADHFGLDATYGGDEVTISFGKYRERFALPEERDVIVEHDHRFCQPSEINRKGKAPESIYQNILDERIDYVGQIDNFPTHIADIAASLGISKPFRFWEERSAYSRLRLSEESRQEIATMYRRDIEEYVF